MDISGNMPVGRISKDNDGRAPWLPGKDMSAWSTLCDTLAKSKIKSFKAANCYLGPEPVSMLASTLSKAGVAEVDISGNKIGDDGKRALATVLPAAKLQRVSLDLGNGKVQLAASDTALSLANKGMKPIDIQFLASWLSTEATARVETVDLSNNSFDPSLLDVIKDKVKLNLTGCRA